MVVLDDLGLFGPGWLLIGPWPASYHISEPDDAYANSYVWLPIGMWPG